MSRRNKPKDSEDWVELSQPLSQDGSEDGNMQELLKAIQVGHAKKKKQAELNLLQTTRKNLEICSKSDAQALRDIDDTFNDRLAEMLEEYTSIDEDVKETWTAILDEHERFTTFCDTSQSSFDALDDKREEKADAALRTMRSACMESLRAIEHVNKLIPSNASKIME